MPVHQGDIFYRLEKIKQMLKALPKRAGNEAHNFFLDNFKLQGWQGDNGLQKWDKRKSNLDPKRGILVGKQGGHLRRGLRSIVTSTLIQEKVTGPATKYADAHNFGETIRIPVTPKMRKWAWAMYYKLGGESIKEASKTMGEKSSLSKHSAILFYKRLAMTKKSTLTVKMPVRKFIGNSKMLDKRLQTLFENDLDEALNR